MSEIRVNPITITDTESGKQYTLEFTRETVAFSERNGFALEDVQRALVTQPPLLFYYAFRAHHKGMPQVMTDKIFDQVIGQSDQLLARLAELYRAPLEYMYSGEGNTNPTMKLEL